MLRLRDGGFYPLARKNPISFRVLCGKMLGYGEANPAIKGEITAFMDGLRKRNKGETEF